MRLSEFTLLFLLTAMLVIVPSIRPAAATGRIFIRADGSIDPPTAPIFTSDKMTYTLLSNITADLPDGIVIQRNNIVLDGAGFTITGKMLNDSNGIALDHTAKVTITNVSIKSFRNGILGNTSSSNFIVETNLTYNDYGINLISSNFNTIEGNNMSQNNWGGIWLQYSQNNNITSNRLANTIANNFGGIRLLDFSDNNNIIGNYITANTKYGIYIENCWSNHIYHNNFVNNLYQGYVDPMTTQTNYWDGGYLLGGNYWNDYTGKDLRSGRFQNESGSDGIGDTSYVIDSNNIDNYPLMKPWTPYENGTIYIRNDGSIDPTGAPLRRKGDSYAVTGSIECNNTGIVIQRDNMILDAANFALQGTLAANSIGVDLSNRNSVTIENMNIDKFINGIFLSNSSNCTILGNNLSNTSYCIYLHSSKDNSVAANNMTIDVVSGIALDGSNHNSVFGNNINGLADSEGIVLASSDNNSLSENSIKNSLNGIDLQSSDTNSISNNDLIANHGVSILLCSSLGNILRGNNMVQNTYSLGVHDGFINDIDVSNTIDGKPIYYWVSVTTRQVPTDAGQVFLVNCSNITVQNLTLANNEQSVVLANTTDSMITQNNVTNNDYGIDLELSSRNNSIVGNSLTNNLNGLVISFSSNNNVIGNNIDANVAVGISVNSSNSNVIVANNVTRSNNGSGITLWNSCENAVSTNNITSNNLNGMSLDSFSSNNSIIRNNIATNNAYGVSLWLSSNNTVSGNNIAYNMFGVGLNSSGNFLFHNNFMSNNQQIQSNNSTNIWDNGYPSGGNYWNDYRGTDFFSGPFQNETGADGIGDTSYVLDPNNTDHYPIANLWTPPDIAATNVATTKTVIGQGFTETVNVTFENPEKIETFNIFVYANSTIIQMEKLTIAMSSYTISFQWNTSGLTHGNYTLITYAEPLPEEENISNNNCSCTTPVHVGIPGDVSGPIPGASDGQVDMRDISYLVAHFYTHSGSLGWSPNCDIDNNGIVNIRDIAISVLYFNQHE